MSKAIRTPHNGLSIVYSPVNQAYFILWLAQVLAIKTHREEAIAIYDELTRPAAPTPGSAN